MLALLKEQWPNLLFLLFLVGWFGIALSTRNCPLCVVGDWLTGRNAGTAVPQRSLPAWSLQELDGGMLTSDQLAGKVKVLNFWASWCGPCKAELPVFRQVQEQYRERGVQFVGVALDEDPEALRQFLADNELNYPVVFTTAELVQAVGGVRSVPTTVIVGPDDTLHNKHIGVLNEKQLQRELDAVLDQG